MLKDRKLFLPPLNVKQKKSFVIGVGVGLLYSAMLVATPFLVSWILNSADQGALLGFQYSIGMLVSMRLLYCIMTMLLYMFHKRAINDFILSIKLEIEEKSVLYILNNENSPSKAVNIINHDIPSVCELYYRNIFKIVSSASFIVAGLIYSGIISFYAFIIETLFLLAAAATQLFFKKQLSASYDSYRNERQNAIKVISSFINGRLAIKSNDAMAYANSSVETQIRKKAKAEASYYLRKRISSNLVVLTPMAATLFSSVLFLFLIVEGIVEKNNALAGAYVVGYIIWELIKLIPLLNDISTVKSIREYVRVACSTTLLQTDKNIKVENKQQISNISKISFDQVSVKYSEKTVLSNISLDLHTTKKYLILGNSGSGKSTLLQAMMDFVSYDGTISDDSELGKKYIDLLNYLPQTVEVFPGTVSANISINDFPQKSEIAFAMKSANCCDLNTEGEINPTVTSFSGGELRKIAFSRAMYYRKSRPILLLDEPFEGLDILSRRVIENEILCHDGMALVVSHIVDNDFLEHIDGIIILEAGTIVYCGRYQDIPSALKQYYLQHIAD